MPWFDFFWYTENIEHLAEHGVAPEEFEEVVIAAKWIETSDSGSDMVRGVTSTGRFLICIFDQLDEVSVIPVTAYEPTKGNE